MSEIKELREEKKAIEDKINEIIDTDLREFIIKHSVDVSIYADFKKIQNYGGDVFIKGATQLNVSLY